MTRERWSRLPDLPLPLAGMFAGARGGALLAAGGSDVLEPWTDRPRKRWHDAIWRLEAGAWSRSGALPRPSAYGVSAATAAGLLCIGGSGEAAHHRACLLLPWDGGPVRQLPPLPEPRAFACGAQDERHVWLIGGSTAPDVCSAAANGWRIDLAAVVPAWQPLPPLPAPGRILAVAAMLDGDPVVAAGAALSAGRDGRPRRTYLRDAWRLAAGSWCRLADLPRGLAAAPSPAPVRDGRMLVVCGDDGRHIDWPTPATHPGFPREVLAYDPVVDGWSGSAPVPTSVVTAPVVPWLGGYAIIGGESRPRERSAAVWTMARS